MSFLEVKNIDVFYGDVQVIFDLSLEVIEGEVVSIIGGNGAGKSTLLKTISGLINPAKGEIVFEHAPIQTAPPEEIVERGIIQVPEGRRLFTLMSVKDNLIIGAYNSRAEKNVAETMEDVYSLLPKLKERESQLAMTLSGGEQQMVAIGRALMSQPRLLLLDELSLGLAPLLVRNTFQVIKLINESRQITIFLVEQNVHMALEASKRAYIIETGRVVGHDQANLLLNSPHVKEAYLGFGSTQGDS